MNKRFLTGCLMRTKFEWEQNCTFMHIWWNAYKS